MFNATDCKSKEMFWWEKANKEIARCQNEYSQSPQVWGIWGAQKDPIVYTCSNIAMSMTSVEESDSEDIYNEGV